jgi:hypothetical protein
MKPFIAAVLAALMLPAFAISQERSAPTAGAQKLNLDFPDLAAKAREKAEVDLDAAALGQARQLAGQAADGKAKEAVNALSGVNGVHVRHYEFADANAYSDSVLDPLRKQVSANPAWSRIISVKEKNENTEIFIMVPGAVPAGGLLVISAEAKEVNVVEILGTVELGRLKELVKSSISYDLKASAAAK